MAQALLVAMSLVVSLPIAAGAETKRTQYIRALDRMMVKLGPQSAHAGRAIRTQYRPHLDFLVLDAYDDLAGALWNGGLAPLPHDPLRFNVVPRITRRSAAAALFPLEWSEVSPLDSQLASPPLTARSSLYSSKCLSSHAGSSASALYSSVVIERFAYWQETMNMPRPSFQSERTTLAWIVRPEAVSSSIGASGFGIRSTSSTFLKRMAL